MEVATIEGRCCDCSSSAVHVNKAAHPIETAEGSTAVSVLYPRKLDRRRTCFMIWEHRNREKRACWGVYVCVGGVSAQMISLLIKFKHRRLFRLVFFNVSLPRVSHALHCSMASYHLRSSRILRAARNLWR